MARKKKESKKSVWMMGFIAFIMVSSIIGYTWKGGAPKVEYNGISFKEEETGAWTSQIQGQKLSLNYHPKDLESIDVEPGLSERLDTLEIDTTYDINDSYAEYIAKVQFVLEDVLGSYNIFVLRAFTAENEYGKPVLTCDNATRFVPVVYFKKSNQTRISIEDNCIIAEAYTGQDLLRIKDRIIYSALGVMP